MNDLWCLRILVKNNKHLLKLNLNDFFHQLSDNWLDNEFLASFNLWELAKSCLRFFKWKRLLNRWPKDCICLLLYKKIYCSSFFFWSFPKPSVKIESFDLLARPEDLHNIKSIECLAFKISIENMSAIWGEIVKNYSRSSPSNRVKANRSRKFLGEFFDLLSERASNTIFVYGNDIFIVVLLLDGFDSCLIASDNIQTCQSVFLREFIDHFTNCTSRSEIHYSFCFFFDGHPNESWSCKTITVSTGSWI